MELSVAGLEFLEGWEGLRLTPYLDSGGRWTVGWGHLMHADDDKHQPITREVAVNLLMFDTHSAVSDVNELVTVDLLQRQFDALVDFVFNLGHGNFLKSSLLKHLNANTMMTAAGEFPKWNRVNGAPDKGVTKRRIAEQAMFVNGDYAGRP